MPKTDQSLNFLPDVAVAFALLTRLPLPRLSDAAFAHQARAAWAFPIVGVVVALLAGGLGVATLMLDLPVSGAAGLVLGAQIVLTGAMHEDGLADTADGLWGGWTRARRLEIMKDSAIGTYGVLALILSLGLRWSALVVLLPVGIAPLVVAATLSRALLPALMTALPHARSDGLSQRVGRPGWSVAAVAAILGLICTVALFGAGVVFPLFLTIIPVTAVGLIARAKIGGQTGDILGASQQITETAVLLGFAAVLAV